MSQPAIKLKTADLDTLCHHLDTNREPLVFEHRGKSYVLISLEDYEFYQELEDENDLRAARAAMDEPGESIPWEEASKRLGLNPLFKCRILTTIS